MKLHPTRHLAPLAIVFAACGRRTETENTTIIKHALDEGIGHSFGDQ